GCGRQPHPLCPQDSGGTARVAEDTALGRGEDRGEEGRAVAEYRIDDLARAAGTTVRNVRVYQDRGLLPPPRREGRTGLYGEPHLARLRLIGQLLEKGYTFAHIAEF